MSKKISIPDTVTVKPCPFCKNSDRNYFEVRLCRSYHGLIKQRYQLECQLCGVKGPMSSSLQVMYIKWNTRRLYIIEEYARISD